MTFEPRRGEKVNLPRLSAARRPKQLKNRATNEGEARETPSRRNMMLCWIFGDLLQRQDDYHIFGLLKSLFCFKITFIIDFHDSHFDHAAMFGKIVGIRAYSFLQ